MKKIREIERRWLLKDVPSLPYSKKIDILQFYTEESFRYRREIDMKSGEASYIKIRKTSVSYGVNEEEIFECDSVEFIRELASSTKAIHKLRYVYEHEDVKFEVDFFYRPHLIIMEVELEYLDYSLQIPQEIQDMIILEITGIKQFSNYNLCVPKTIPPSSVSERTKKKNFF